VTGLLLRGAAGCGLPRERNLPADAIEQQGAQLLFQHVNAFADGRLCNVQSLGGSRKGSAIGDCHECSQILCVHAGPKVEGEIRL